MSKNVRIFRIFAPFGLIDLDARILRSDKIVYFFHTSDHTEMLATHLSRPTALGQTRFGLPSLVAFGQSYLANFFVVWGGGRLGWPEGERRGRGPEGVGGVGGPKMSITSDTPQTHPRQDTPQTHPRQNKSNFKNVRFYSISNFAFFGPPS